MNLSNLILYLHIVIDNNTTNIIKTQYILQFHDEKKDNIERLFGFNRFS